MAALSSRLAGVDIFRLNEDAMSDLPCTGPSEDAVRD
jgi:hypothetical protein